jgi:hypothetical protein
MEPAIRNGHKGLTIYKPGKAGLDSRGWCWVKEKKRAGVGHLRNPMNAIVSVVYYLLKSALCLSKVKG